MYTRENSRKCQIPVQNWLNLLSDGLDIIHRLWFERYGTGMSQDTRCVTGGVLLTCGFVAGYTLRDRRLHLKCCHKAPIALRRPAFATQARSRNANPGTHGTSHSPCPVTQHESCDTPSSRPGPFAIREAASAKRNKIIALIAKLRVIA